MDSIRHVIKKIPGISLLLMLLASFVTAQEIIPLYAGEVPNTKPNELVESEISNGMYRMVKKPTLEYFKPEVPNGTAIIIVPGGGYGVIVYNGEGVGQAKEFAKQGISAFVLKYRLPSGALMEDPRIGPLQDAQQAIMMVRENAEMYGVDKNKIGIMGFSAGGHLASTAATHFETSYIENTKNTSLRPDFQILVYPVITMADSLTHMGSRTSLLGKNPSAMDIKLFSNEEQITARTPPTYLTHAADDKVVDVDNSIIYFEKLRKEKVEVEMHIYPKGDHGFVFRHKGWMDPLMEWLKRNSWL